MEKEAQAQGKAQAKAEACKIQVATLALMIWSLFLS